MDLAAAAYSVCRVAYRNAPLFDCDNLLNFSFHVHSYDHRSLRDIVKPSNEPSAGCPVDVCVDNVYSCCSHAPRVSFSLNAVRVRLKIFKVGSSIRMHEHASDWINGKGFRKGLLPCRSAYAGLPGLGGHYISGTPTIQHSDCLKRKFRGEGKNGKRKAWTVMMVHGKGHQSIGRCLINNNVPRCSHDGLPHLS